MTKPTVDAHISGSGHFVALDSLRGLAALIVVIHHMKWTSVLYEVPLVRNGYLMVDFFFVLSGFVIAYNYAGRLHDAKGLSHFVWLRFWRLYPLHFVFLMVFLGIEVAKYLAKTFAGFGGEAFVDNNFDAFLSNLFLVQALNLHSNYTFNDPAWSISTEFYTYLLFALVVVAIGRRRNLLVVSLALSTASFAVLYPHWKGQWDFTYNMGFLRCTFGFFLGVAAAEIHLRVREVSIISMDHMRKIMAALSIMAALALVVVANVSRNGSLDLVVCVLSFPLILFLSLSPGGQLDRLLRAKPLVWLGTVSYSIYMSHQAVLWILTEALYPVMHIPMSAQVLALPPLLGNTMTLIALALVLGLSQITYSLIEDPFRLWSKRAWKARDSVMRPA